MIKVMTGGKRENFTSSLEVMLDSSPLHEVIQLFSCSTQLSMEFQMLITTKILTNNGVSCFKSLICCILLC